MKLTELMNRCGCFSAPDGSSPEITMVATDSRLVRQGGLFVAIEGFKDNGLRYVDDALRRGAAAVIVEERFMHRLSARNAAGNASGAGGSARGTPGTGSASDTGSPVFCTTRSARRCALLASRAFFREPSRAMTLIGVTGTNGKTTTTYLLEAILSDAGRNPGVIGTISYRFNDVVRKANNTTPDPAEIQALFARMREGGVTHVVMEVSSHALAMDRVMVPDFDIAVFTNLSQDHLDFHKSMEEYFRAKALLFEGLEGASSAVINRDDPYGQRLLALTRARTVSYAIHAPADLRASVLSLSLEGTRFSVNGKEFTTHLVGEHNVYNFLCAYAAARVLGVGDEAVERALRNTTNVPGRFERVGAGKGLHVFVDYAHTPDALDRLLDAASSLKQGKIITVFGCGGDRDRGKRPLMGGAVERKSDIAIVTSDNPRTEDPMSIIEDIKKGLTGDNHFVVPDRREAIFMAIEMASPGDIVLIAGKGHEDYQILGSRTVHFDDREVASEALDNLKKAD
jgi:UDP-N-acetylmuramoyl-L-alanyl-D-glutamate--2,6-diaminopimelate ligase